MSDIKSLTIYVAQDGADFYIYRSPDMSKLHDTWHYLGRVRDFDMPEAQKARMAFEAQAKLAGYLVEWPNPFEES